MMSRRWLWLVAAGLCRLAVAAPCMADDRPARPNILYLLADDWMYPHASCLGDPVIRTPTFDRLAREGVLFRNAYAAAPTCTASRGAMPTGQWSWRLEEGAYLNLFLPAKFDLPVLRSAKSGQVDPARDHVLTCMETHVPCRRIGGDDLRGGYPMRAIRTKDFHYIRNFKPERWPAGNPNGCQSRPPPFTYDQLVRGGHLAFGDVDASPTKAWMVLHRDDPHVRPLWDRAFGKRPAQELYDLGKDPHQMRNMTGDPAYAKTLKELDDRLMAELTATGDPRAAGKGDVFEQCNPWRPKMP